MVLQTDQYQSQIDNLNFRLGEFLNVRRALNSGEKAEVQRLLDEYRALNSNLRTAIGEVGTGGDIGQITTNIGQFQENIKELEQRLKEVKQEVDTSVARKRSVERVEQDVSYHQLYIMDRPLRQLSIPTLFTISIVFVFSGIFFLYKLYKGDATGHGSSGHTATNAGYGGLAGLFGSSTGHAYTGRAPPAAPAHSTNTGLSAILPSFNLSGIGLSSLWGK
jgi:hypothetical protein